MTPRIFYNIAKKAEDSKDALNKVGLVAFILFLLAVLINFIAADILYAITLTPLAFLFLLFCIALVTAWYKDDKNQENNFQYFWQSTNAVKKLFLWYGSVFITFSIGFIILFMVFSTIHTIYYVYQN